MQGGMEATVVFPPAQARALVASCSKSSQGGAFVGPAGVNASIAAKCRVATNNRAKLKLKHPLRQSQHLTTAAGSFTGSAFPLGCIWCSRVGNAGCKREGSLGVVKGVVKGGVRAGAGAQEPIYEDGDLYEAPDAYGGWKGIRKSPLTEEWEKKGTLVTVGDYDWFVVDQGPSTGAPKSTVLLVPGLPAHSYSFREVTRLLSEAGHRAVTFDWLGFGLSDKPNPKSFGYRPADFLQGLEGLLAVLAIDQVTLVAQGFLGGTVGTQYAAAHPEIVSKLVILNAPLQQNCRLPKPFQQLTLPFIGAAFAQDPTRLADYSFNSSGPYEMSEDDLQVYRQPYMESSDAGFAALAAVKNLDLKDDVARCRDLLTSDSFRTLTLMALSSQDKWLSQPSDLLALLRGRPWFSTTVLEGAGHFAQEDWPEKVTAAIRRL